MAYILKMDELHTLIELVLRRRKTIIEPPHNHDYTLTSIQHLRGTHGC